MTTLIDQALIEEWQTQAFGIATAYPNEDYTPVPGADWVQLRIFHNPVLPVGLASLSDTTGAFQVVLNRGDRNSIAASQQIDTIFAAFPVGRRLSRAGQAVTITGHHRQSSKVDNGWLKVVGLINYRADVAR